MLKREYMEHFKDGGATAPSRGRGIFQQKDIRDLQTSRRKSFIRGQIIHRSRTYRHITFIEVRKVPHPARHRTVL